MMSELLAAFDEVSMDWTYSFLMEKCWEKKNGMLQMDWMIAFVMKVAVCLHVHANRRH